MKNFLPFITILTFLLLVTSCKKDETPKYSVPTTYSFSNVDYSGQTTRLAMIEELVDAVKVGSTAGNTLDAAQLRNMYSNSGNPFSSSILNSSGKQLKDKTFLAEQSTIETWIDNAAIASQAGASGSNGIAGIVSNGTKSYLLDENGFDYKEGVEKHLQGALIYYQITAVYLSEDKVGPQVTLADRQHHWDEAFGYFGVPIDYPTNTAVLQQLGEYADARNSLLGNSTAIMNAYLKGRAAINNNDNSTVTAQVEIIRENLEKTLSATAIHYINVAVANISDDAVRSHTLSEAYFLIKSLKYNPAKKVSDAQIQTLLNYFGGNFYTVSTANLQAAKDMLSTIYGFDAVKNQL